MLYVKAKITANDGTNLAADAAVGPANLFLHSLFSQVDISLSGTLVTPSTNTYPYRAMLETLLSYGEDSKKSLCTLVADVASRRQLRSASQNIPLVPRYKRSGLGRRAFSVGGPFV